jgi:hypothetical protein
VASACKISVSVLDVERGQLGVQVGPTTDLEHPPVIARRQCTREYKIGLLKKAARKLLGYPRPKRVPRRVYVEQAIGTSTDLCRQIVYLSIVHAA